MRSKSVAIVGLLAAVAVLRAPCDAEAVKIDQSLTFADARSLAVFHGYVARLSSAPGRYDEQFATLARLERSDVTYVVRVAPSTEPGVEGDLSTDGSRVFITVSDGDDTHDASLSIDSRLAHELEHARQFDNGELAFVRDERIGAWTPQHSSYDIGDEVKAWEAQLDVSTARDSWLITTRKRQPSVLKLFASATTDEARASVLRAHGYADRYPVPGCDVVFPCAAGYTSGELVRPTDRLAFFGRVRRVV